MSKSRYTLFQEEYGEPGITFTELAGALSEAGAPLPPQRIQKYAEANGLVVDLGETPKGPRYLIRLSNVQKVMDGLRVPISARDLERILETQKESWQTLLVREIRRRKTAI